jgi:hypothetical protein
MSAVVIIVGTRLDGSCAAGAMSSGFWLIGCHWWAADQLEFIVEQQAEVVLRPLGRRVHPGAFDAAGDGVLTEPALVGARPPQALQSDVRGLGRGVDQAWIARAVGLAEGVAAGGQRDRLLVVHRHALEGDLDVARRLQRVRRAAGTFRIDIDQAHLDGGERVL